MRDRPGAGVELVNLTKRFAHVDQPAVDAINLAIRPGEFMTLLGPSGSGKTTTLNMVAGFIAATAGQILVDGVDVAHTPTHKRDMGMVFQQYALFPHMTAYGNLAFPLQQRKVPKDEIARRVGEALALVRLESYAERYPRNLSGGQQQRVAVARALVFGPRVLLMDEPLGALDKRLREQLQVELARIHRNLGITFIFVTHDQEEALSLSDRIAVFNEGRIEQVGTADELYENPSTLFVADFLGDSTVFRGRRTREGIDCPDGRLVFDGASSVPEHTEAAIVVRPERLSLAAETDDVSNRNAVRARVTDVVYLGASRKIVLVTGAGHTAIVRETAGNETRFGPDETVLITWPSNQGVLVGVSGHDAEQAAEIEVPPAG